ncbi:site-2 protease family protein [Fictibacillus iocasae]|uniref:Site-2 protease family protein n=1 Tax=Fictibacillus iocasae TaxID=2715437 RepID=A0ABW2NKP3_9BACL
MINAGVHFFRKLKISPLLWLMAAGAILTGHFREIIIWYVVVLVHEMGHFAGAHLFKWRINKIELMPFGGALSVDEISDKPFKQEAFVTILGPIQHVWMIGLSFLLVSFEIIDSATHQWLVYVNIAIFAFNLLPVWPLDGGRLLFLFFARTMPFYKAQKIFLLFSFIFFLFLLLFYLTYHTFHLNLWMIALFLLSAHYIEWKRRKYVFIRFLLNRYHFPYGYKKKKRFIVPGSLEVGSVLNLFYKSREHEIMVKENPAKSLKEYDLLHAFFHKGQMRCAIREIFR